MSYARASRERATLQRCWRRRDFRAGLAILVALALVAVLSPVLAPYPEEGEGLVTEAARLRGPLPPSAEHPFGTDVFGRDVLSRVLVGSRYSLLQTILVVGGSLALGVLLGSLAGYLGGLLGALMSYAIELFLPLPPILVAAALSVVVGPGMHTVVLSLVMTWWAWYARIAYVQSRQLRDLDFVKVSEALGFGRVHVALHHILPNVAPQVAVQAVLDSAAVLLEVSSINFLIGGIAAPFDAPDWGTMIGYGFRYITSYWWMSLFPGLLLTLAAFGLILVGDAVSEESSPSLRRRWRLWF